MKKIENKTLNKVLAKSLTGIQGLDEITDGGLPTGRPTLICGSAGCGKTLLAMEFLVRGATQYDEPGVFMSFEETAEDLTENVASLGFDLEDLIKRKKMVLDYVYVEQSEIEETGGYDLEGLFIRLNHAIDSIGAKRVVLDTIESLFAGFSNQSILRFELRRLFRWLKDKGVTAIITGERGDQTLTRQGLEEYVSDCVIVLDQRITEQNSTRRLRVVKYRGSMHGTNEYPFLIAEDGFSVLPVTSLGLKSIALTDRITSGIPALDKMLEGKGYYRGSTVLVSGTAGSGKSSMSAHFVDAACKRGERVLYFCFEESPSEIMRNMLSIGIDLEYWANKGLLRFHATRPTSHGLEMHLVIAHRVVNEFKPKVVIFDPINSFAVGDNDVDVKKMLLSLVDFLKMKQVTTLFTSLTSGGSFLENSSIDISSLIDTWLLLKDIELGGERNRVMYVLKSRGMANSNQIREFILTNHGVELRDVYTGASGVLTGSARLAQEAQEEATQQLQKEEVERKQLVLERKRKALESQIASMRAEFEAVELVAANEMIIEQNKVMQLKQDRDEMSESRKKNVDKVIKSKKKKDN